MTQPLHVKFINARELLVTAQVMTSHGQSQIVTDAFNQLDVLVKEIRSECETLLNGETNGTQAEERKSEANQGRNQDPKGQPGRKAKSSRR